VNEVETVGEAPEFRSTACAICGPGTASALLYRSSVAPSDLTPGVFSARRLPDRVHYQMVRCVTCELVRSDPVVESDRLRQLYGESTFDYASEVDDLRSTYGRYLEKLRRRGGEQHAILEVGCGNGFFLEEALNHGYEEVGGVEPSTAAVASAASNVRPNIVCDVMRPGLFPENKFDAVCLFQTFDHLPDPGAVLDASMQALRPGGLLLCLNHNVQAMSARILGERSPIIDVEHTYLYSPETMARIFSLHGYRIVEQGRVLNTTGLRYLIHLFPVPSRAKRTLASLVRALRLDRVRLRLPLGNLYLIAQKPA
jgi:SAM-dependent methyltransferase